MKLLRENWRWLLILSCMPLFAAKTLFNLPMAIMMFIGIYRVVRDPRGALADPLIRLLLYLFLCFEIPILLSLPDAVHFNRAFSTALVDLRFLFAGVFIIETLKDAVARRRLFIGVVVLGIGWCLDALLQMGIGFDLLGYPYNGSRPTGIFHPKLRIGTVTGALFPVLLEGMRVYGARFRAVWLALPPVLALIILSGNRNAWMMLAEGLVLYFIYLYFVTSRRRFTRSVVGTLVVLLLAVGAVSQYKPLENRAETTMGVLSENTDILDEATGMRLSLWQTAYNMYLGNWINGVGPRGYRYAYLDYAEADDFWANKMTTEQDYPQSHPHQMLLEIAAETGTIGLVGFAVMVVLYLRAAFRANPSQRSRVWPWVIAAMVAWSPTNAHMAIYASYWGTIAWWILLVSLGMMNTEAADEGG